MLTLMNMRDTDKCYSNVTLGVSSGQRTNTELKLTNQLTLKKVWI